MLRQRANQMINLLKNKPDLISNTISQTQSLEFQNIFNSQLPLTHCSGPIKQKIRHHILKVNYEKSKSEFTKLTKGEVPVIQIVNQLNSISQMIIQADSAVDVIKSSRKVIDYQQKFNADIEFQQFKLNVLEQFDKIVSLSEQEKVIIFGNPFQIQKSDILELIYHLSKMKRLKDSIQHLNSSRGNLKQKQDKNQDEQQAQKEDKLKNRLDENIKTIEQRIKPRIIQFTKNILRSKRTPQTLMQNIQDFTILKYAFKLLYMEQTTSQQQQQFNKSSIQMIWKRLQHSLQEAVCLEASKISKISAPIKERYATLTQRSFRLSSTYKSIDDGDDLGKRMDKQEMETINWSDTLGWLIQTGKELELLLQECLSFNESQQNNISGRKQVLYTQIIKKAKETIIYQKLTRNMQKNISIKTVTQILAIFKDYDEIVKIQAPALLLTEYQHLKHQYYLYLLLLLSTKFIQEIIKQIQTPYQEGHQAMQLKFGKFMSRSKECLGLYQNIKNQISKISFDIDYDEDIKKKILIELKQVVKQNKIQSFVVLIKSMNQIFREKKAQADQMQFLDIVNIGKDQQVIYEFKNEIQMLLKFIVSQISQKEFIQCLQPPYSLDRNDIQSQLQNLAHRKDILSVFKEFVQIQ